MVDGIFSIKVETSGAVFNKPYRESIIRRQLLKTFTTSLVLLDRETKKRTPVVTGTLRRSIFHQILGHGISIKGLVGTSLKYAMTVEHGRKPGSFPNIDSLELYVRRKYHLSGRELDQAVYFIAKAIRDKGFKGKKMFRNAFLESTAKIKLIFSKYGLNVVKALD